MSRHLSIHVSNYSFIFVLGKFNKLYGNLESIFKGIKISDQLGSAPLFCLAKKAFSRQRHRCSRNHKDAGFLYKNQKQLFIVKVFNSLLNHSGHEIWKGKKVPGY